MSKELNHAIYALQDRVREAEYALGSVAEKLYDVGLIKAADSIHAAFEGVVEMVEEVHRAYGRNLDEQIRYSGGITMGLLQVAMSGALRTPEERAAAKARGEFQTEEEKTDGA